MKIIGLDYGEARTGIAISDELGMMAHGLETIEHGPNEKLLIEKIKRDYIASNYKYYRVYCLILAKLKL